MQEREALKSFKIIKGRGGGGYLKTWVLLSRGLEIIAVWDKKQFLLHPSPPQLKLWLVPNTRATWKGLNKILNRKKRNSKSCSTFKADDREIILILWEFANKFCSYFSSIGPDLTSGIQWSASHRSFLNGSFTQSIFFNPTTQDMRSLKLRKHFFQAKPLATTRFQWQSRRSPIYLFPNHSPIS